MARIYIEGGGDAKDLKVRCREGFRKLLEGSGFVGRMPRLVACGSRHSAFGDFETAYGGYRGEYVALLVDSEAPVSDVEAPWAHLEARDGWTRPSGAEDNNAFLMVSSMETWIAADPQAVQLQFGPHVRLSELPSVVAIEARTPASILAALKAATTHCPSPYVKGYISFAVLGRTSPGQLSQLPAFARMIRILGSRL